MNLLRHYSRQRRGHTLMELVVAMAASSFLLAGMGSVMFIARQIAFTPNDSIRRAKAADVVAQIGDDLRYATLIIQQTPQILEFVVADRNADGTAEKIRYDWSGTAGAPLRKTVNGGTAVDVLPSVNVFNTTLQQTQKTTTIATTVESAETTLLSHTAVSSALYRDVDTSNFSSQKLLTGNFLSVPSNAISWNATRFEFYGKQSGTANDTLIVQLRPTGDPNDGPASTVAGQATVAESSLVTGWNSVTFPSPIRGLSLNRVYDIVLMQASGTGAAAQVAYNDSSTMGVNDSSDSGASWQFLSTRQVWRKVYGTYNTPGTSYNVTRNYVSSVRIALQSGSQGYARVDASAPLRNLPELLSTYWRTDFDRDPTATNGNGDTVSDWAVTGNGAFDSSKLVNGVWAATGAIETRPLADFTTTTVVDVRCRNTSVGGNGAVIRINADRQGGTYAPILVYVQRQADGTQTLTLNSKTSDATTKQLFSRTKLSSSFVQYRLTILPSYNLVNLQINGEDQGTCSYSTYSPSGTTDRYLTLYADTSAAEFDYVDLRVETN